ncbi:zinc-dependent alcohol dehydrogenase family protein [Paenibacillus sp. 1_12]|uniref:zinc-dependent alcohol dehydrogenase family protein n=1 Tax=Paenibacillus sp. 1_12 TaxID=1566278 RepID=UPI000B85302F|nr:zinc-dependent alcohol dehydrogenase family protein [Paenibacillus sp. 1_12]
METKCIRYHEFGNPQHVLRIENKKMESPGRGEVLVRMIARPINPSDLIPITGAYSHRISLPDIPGYEGFGIVVEAGPSVSQELIGKRVLPLRGEGTWQHFVKASADWVVPLPDYIEDYIAAQLYINPVSAWLTCTEILNLKSDDVVIVNACGSSVGRIFAQFSKILGFRLIAVTRNDSYTKELLQLGASYVINTTVMPLHPTIMELTNGLGAHAAIDSVGGTSGTDLAFCVRPNGILLTIGLLSGKPVNWAEITHKAQVNVKMFHLRYWNQQVSVQAWHDTFNQLISLLYDKRLSLMLPKSHYDLTEIHEAVRAAVTYEANQGKVFLTS